MMSDTSNKVNVIGDKIRAASYFGRNNGLHTISVTYSNFVGEFKIQATLSLTPTENDWFDINLQSKNADIGTSIRFPLDPANPTGRNGDSGIMAFTFLGQFTYLRAVLNRDYLGTITPLAIPALGQINKVLLAF